jgi:uncharacterized protein
MKKLVLTFIAFFFGLAVFCQTSFDIEKLLTQKPVPQKLVNDYAGILTSEQEYALEQKLIALDDNTSTQIAVVLVPNLGGNDISDFNVKLLRAWGVGGKKNNNGVVVLICTEDKNRKINIATGYGVEGALPDILCKQIIDNEFIPSFKGKDYYRGIDQGTNAIIQAVKGEYNVKRDRNTGGRGAGSGFVFIFILLIIFFIMSRRGGGGNNGTFMSRRGQRGIADAIFWNTILNSGGGGGGWSGGGGDSGGGGFGGFGGGSGGGGGASGDW